MKELFQHRITALHIAEQLPPSVIKNRDINGFFDWVTYWKIDIDDRTEGDIRYREVYYKDQEEVFEVSVIVIQSDTSCMVIIDTDFGEEEEAYMSSNVMES